MTALLVTVAKVSLILAAALAALPMLRRRPAAVRHLVIAIAIACALTLPALQTFAPGWGASLFATSASAASDTPASLELSSLPPPVRSATASVVPTVANGGVRLMMLVWAAGALAALAALTGALLRLAVKTRRSAAAVDPSLDLLLAEIARESGARVPTLVLADDPSMILTWGWLRPVIVLPNTASRWPLSRLRLVLRHELAHVRRGDWVVLLLASVLRAVYWFNPLAWIACQRLRQESEQACDNEVLSSGVAAQDYAAHLLELARAAVAHRHRWSPAPAIARPSTLHSRIAAMLDTHVDRAPVSRAACLMLTAVLVAITIPLAGFAKLDASPLRSVAADVSTAAVPRGTVPAIASPLSPPTANAAVRRPGAAPAQGAAAVFGTLYDESGGVLPGAALTLTNTASSASASFQTDRFGYYQIPDVPPGSYTIDVSLPGFEYTRREVVLRTGDNQEQNFTLPVGSIMETVTIIDDGQPITVSADELARREARKQESLERTRGELEAERQRRSARAANVTSPTIGGQIQAPRMVARRNPVFPQALRGTGQTGQVLLQATIGIDGSIEQMRVLESAHPEFSQSALDAVGDWHFTPTLLNGTPVPVTMTVNLLYRTQ